MKKFWLKSKIPADNAISDSNIRLFLAIFTLATRVRAQTKIKGLLEHAACKFWQTLNIELPSCLDFSFLQGINKNSKMREFSEKCHYNKISACHQI